MIDFCNTEDAVYLDGDIDLIIQQIDMLFGTIPTEVLGDPSYGSEYDNFLWDLNYSNKQIEMYATSQLNEKVEWLGYSHDVKVSLLHGETNDIILLEVNIYTDDKKYSKTYKIE